MRGNMFELGDRVAFRGAFLRAIDAHELANEVGTVVEVYSAGAVVVVRTRWDSGTTGSALMQNLVLNERKHLEAV